ncbi:MAG: UbiA family prenyltransferase [Phycisphaeraceae bacterium]
MQQLAQCYGTAVPWVVFTNLYVALCGAALTASSGALLGVPIRIDAAVGLVFCCTLVIYNLDRLVEPSPGDSEHERWVASHRGLLWGTTAISAAGTVILAWQLSSAALLSLPIAGAVAVGYCLPVIRLRGRWIRLKALPGAKLILIALVWTYATAGLPMLDNGIALNASTIFVLLARFFFIAAVALPFDLPDMQRDRRSGIATLPIMLGVDQTQRVAFALITLSALCSTLNPWPYASALLICCACVTGLIAILRPDRGVLYFMVALDGMLLVQAGLLWASAV